MITNLERLNSKPIDPLTQSEYTYSRLNTKKEFEIGAIIEWCSTDLSFISTPSTNAAWTLQWTAYVKWNYNWIIAKVTNWPTTYVLAVPTIISWDILLTDIMDIIQ